MRRSTKLRKAIKVAATGLTGLYIAASGIYMGVAMDQFLRRFQAPETCVTSCIGSCAGLNDRASFSACNGRKTEIDDGQER